MFNLKRLFYRIEVQLRIWLGLKPPPKYELPGWVKRYKNPKNCVPLYKPEPYDWEKE